MTRLKMELGTLIKIEGVIATPSTSDLCNVWSSSCSYLFGKGFLILPENLRGLENYCGKNRNVFFMISPAHHRRDSMSRKIRTTQLILCF
jgi:hypothetical protein